MQIYNEFFVTKKKIIPYQVNSTHITVRCVGSSQCDNHSCDHYKKHIKSHRCTETTFCDTANGLHVQYLCAQADFKIRDKSGEVLLIMKSR